MAKGVYEETKNQENVLELFFSQRIQMSNLIDEETIIEDSMKCRKQLEDLNHEILLNSELIKELEEKVPKKGK